MATQDAVSALGGRPADFCDIGAGADAAEVENVMRRLAADPATDAVLVNVFGGMTRCDPPAMAFEGRPAGARGRGNRAAGGRALLEASGSGFRMEGDFAAAVRAAVEEASAATGGRNAGKAADSGRAPGTCARDARPGP